MHTAELHMPLPGLRLPGRLLKVPGRPSWVLAGTPVRSSATAGEAVPTASAQGTRDIQWLVALVQGVVLVCLLVALFLAALEGGRWLRARAVVADAALAGARLAVSERASDAMAAAAASRTLAAAGLEADHSVEVLARGEHGFVRVRVQARMEHPLLPGFLARLLGLDRVVADRFLPSGEARP